MPLNRERVGIRKRLLERVAADLILERQPKVGRCRSQVIREQIESGIGER